MTAEDLTKLRAKKRATAKAMMSAFALGVLGAVGFAVADVGFTPILKGEAVVLGKRDTWSFKHGQRCITKLQTNFGKTSILDYGLCAERPWTIGQHVRIAVRIGRVIHSVGVMRNYGLFALPYPKPAAGLNVFPMARSNKYPPFPRQMAIHGGRRSSSYADHQLSEGIFTL